ncbi:hypothetical protein Tco_1150321, partial [Tanacetum coccineum]
MTLLGSFYALLKEEHPSSPDYVHGFEYPEYVAPSDDEILVEDQPLPADASPTTLSPGYVADFDLLEEDHEEDPADYPADGGDDDEEDEESSEDDDDDEEEDEAFEEDEEEDEKHLALADFAALPAIDHVPLAEETKPFETNKSIATPPPPPRSPQTMDPFSQTCLRRARKTVRLQPPMAASTKALIAEFASAPIPPLPPPSLLLPWSSPLPQIPSTPLPVLSPPLPLPSPPTHTSPTYADAPLGYKAAMIQSRATSPPHVPSLPLFEIGESSTTAAARQTGHTLACRVDYGFIDTVNASMRASEGRVMTAVEEVNERVTDLAATKRQDAHQLQQEAVITRHAWSRLEDRSTALEASDLVTTTFGRIHALEARDRACTRDAGHQDGSANDGSSSSMALESL